LYHEAPEGVKLPSSGEAKDPGPGADGYRRLFRWTA